MLPAEPKQWLRAQLLEARMLHGTRHTLCKSIKLHHLARLLASVGMHV
jgi:hypothetical protein